MQDQHHIFWFPIGKKSLIFGKYNDHPENPSETNKVLASFKQFGIQALRDNTSIPIILKAAWLNDDLNLPSSFAFADELQELKLKDTEEIIVASGQHHISALKKYLSQAEEAKENALKHIKEIEDLDILTNEDVANYNRQRKVVAEMMGILRDISWWGVTLYDEGM